MARSLGSDKLARIVLSSHANLASERIGSSRPAVVTWIHGVLTPSQFFREKIALAYPQIAPSDWDDPPVERDPPIAFKPAGKRGRPKKVVAEAPSSPSVAPVAEFAERRETNAARQRPASDPPTPIVPSVSPASDPPAPVAEVALTGRDRALELIRQIDEEIDACDSLTPKNHKASLFGQKRSAVEALAKIDGDVSISEAKILNSPAWRRIADALERTWRAHPGSAARFREELDRDAS